MTVAFVVAYVFALAVMGYAIRRVRQLRRQLERAGSAAFKAQVRRAQQFAQFCDPCKQTVNPWWTNINNKETR